MRENLLYCCTSDIHTTKESFQKGLMPSGSPDSGSACVTARMSTMMKQMLTIIDASKTPKRGDTRISSRYPNSYRLLMFQKRFRVVKIHHGSLNRASYGRVEVKSLLSPLK